MITRWKGFDSSENTWEWKEDLLADGHHRAIEHYKTTKVRPSSNKKTRSRTPLRSVSPTSMPSFRVDTPVPFSLNLAWEEETSVRKSSLAWFYSTLLFNILIASLGVVGETSRYSPARGAIEASWRTLHFLLICRQYPPTFSTLVVALVACIAGIPVEFGELVPSMVVAIFALTLAVDRVVEKGVSSTLLLGVGTAVLSLATCVLDTREMKMVSLVSVSIHSTIEARVENQ